MNRKSKKPIDVKTLTHHEASRKNIPTAEYQAVMEEDDRVRSRSPTSAATATSIPSSSGAAMDAATDEHQALHRRGTRRTPVDAEAGDQPKGALLDKPRVKPAHRQRSFQVSGQAGGEARFSVYQRQSLADESDFSCGIVYPPHGGPPLTLARYNGPSHEHGDITYRPHIHQASERAIAAGKKPESEAEATDRFETLEGALACLVGDFNLSGLKAQYDHPRLFS